MDHLFKKVSDGPLCSVDTNEQLVKTVLHIGQVNTRTCAILILN